MATHSLSSKAEKTQPKALLGQPKTRTLLPKLLGAFFGVIIVGAAAIFAFSSWRNSQNEKANLLFAKALQIYQADLLKDSESLSVQNDVPRFKTRSEKAEASLHVLNDLTNTYPKVPIASLADLVRANILFDLNRTGEAEALYQKKNDNSPPGVLKPLLLEALGLSLEIENKKEEAVKVFKQGGLGNSSFYKPFFEWNEARMAQFQGNSKEATEIYKRLTQLTDWSVSNKLRLQNRLIELE